MMNISSPSIKKVFLFIACITLFPSAYTQEKEEIKALAWQQNDPDFNITKVPEKWKDESAVILASSMNYEVKKKALSKKLVESRLSHYRIKILDEAALKEYSELSFQSKQAYNYWNRGYQVFVGIKIIKEDGTSEEVSLDEAVEKELSLGTQNIEYKKIAVPNLEIGDILDYYIYRKKEYLVYSFFSLGSTFHVFSDDYPILKQKLRVNIMRGCYLNAKSYNGAPSFQRQVSEKNIDNIYTLTYENIEKIKGHKWLYHFRELPSIKMQAFYSTSSSLYSSPFYSAFLGEKGIIKKNMSTPDIQNAGKSIGHSYLRKYLKKIKYKKKEETEEEFKLRYVKECFYYFRDLAAKGQKVSLTRDIRGSLHLKQIDYDIFVTTARVLGEINNIILPDELITFIGVNTSEGYFYFSEGGKYAQLGDISTYIQGCKAYKTHYSFEGKYADSYSEGIITIPVDKAENNQIKSVLNVALIDSSQTKKLSISEDINFFGDYRRSFSPYFTISSEYRNAIKQDRFDKYNFYNAPDTNLDEEEKNRKENIEMFLQNSYSVDKEKIQLNNVSVKEVGLWKNQAALEMNMTYDLESYVKKIGNNYLVELGKLIGEQVELSAEDLKERKYKIYFDKTKKIDQIIKFKIPEGYAVQGLEKFEHEEEHNFGSLKSTIEQKDGYVLFHYQVSHDSLIVNKSLWDILATFTEKSYNLSQQKILLKKI